MKWIASVNRHDNAKDVHASSLINMKNDDDNNNNPQHHDEEHLCINRSPLLTHINEKEEETSTRNHINEEKKKTPTRIHRSPLVTHIHEKKEERSTCIHINDKKEKSPTRIHRSPLLTHINEKKEEISMFTLECITKNISSNDYDGDFINKTNEEEGDWDLVMNNKVRDKSTRRKKMRKVLVDGGANGGITGTEDSQPLYSNFN